MPRTILPIPEAPSQKQSHLTAEGLARVADMLDKLSDQVRASQKAVTDMQRALFLSSNAEQEAGTALPMTAKVADGVMSRAEVCRAFGISPTATTTLARRQDKLLLPRGNHLCGQQAVTWWKSDIDILLGMMRRNAPKQEIQAAVTEMNARNRGGKQEVNFTASQRDE